MVKEEELCLWGDCSAGGDNQVPLDLSSLLYFFSVSDPYE